MAANFYRDFETEAALNAAYDVEKSVPDFGIYAQEFTKVSADTRRRLPHTAGVAYGPTRAEYADIFPAPRPGAPVVIFIHGGYWRSLTAREFSFCAAGPVAAGCTTVVANYALCPDVTMGEIVRQMRALVAWTYAHATRFNADPESLWIAGHSAGGHLAAMCALTDWAEYGLPADTVRGILPISGLFDLEPIRLSWLQPELRLTEDDVYRQSPQRWVRRVPVAMKISYGGAESSEFARQSHDFLDAWRRAGNRGELVPQLGRNHFTAISDLAEPDSPLTRALTGMIGRRARPVPAVPRAGGIDRRLFPERARR